MPDAVAKLHHGAVFYGLLTAMAVRILALFSIQVVFVVWIHRVRSSLPQEKKREGEKKSRKREEQKKEQEERGRSEREGILSILREVEKKRGLFPCFESAYNLQCKLPFIMRKCTSCFFNQLFLPHVPFTRACKKWGSTASAVQANYSG